MEIKAPFLSNYMTVTIICVTTLLWCTWKILNWVWWKPRMFEKKLRQQGLKGTPYRLLFGDLKDLGWMLKEANSKPIEFNNDITTRVNPFIDQTLKNYGKNSFAWVGTKPMLILMDPERIKEVFARRDEFSIQKLNPFHKYIHTGLVTYEGTKWTQTRKTLNQAFHPEKLKLMVPAFGEAASIVINKWDKMLSTNEGLSYEVDVWPYIKELTRYAISRTAFGTSYEQGRRYFDLFNSLIEVLVPLFSSVYIPGWRFLPTKNNKEVRALDKEMREILQDLIGEREKAIRAGESTKDDLLNLLIQSNLKENEEHGNNSKNVGTLDIQEVTDECKLFYFGGQETTAALLVWTLILLAKHPDWQERARQEIVQVFGSEKPIFDGLNNLKLVNAILHEVLRIYPPVPWVARIVQKQEAKLGNLLLPKGILLLLATIHVHQSKEFWGEDASEFNPSRFLDGVSKATKDRLTFFPFSAGPRTCIGVNFSLLEAKVVLSMMLRKFSFDTSPSYAHAPQMLLTMQPQYGAHLILHKL